MAEEKSLKLESKFSSSKSLFWGRWKPTGKTFSSQEEADKYIKQHYEKSMKNIPISSRTDRKGVKNMTFELLPHFGANELIGVMSESGIRAKRDAWEAYHEGGVRKYYIHLRLIPVEAEERR